MTTPNSPDPIAILLDEHRAGLALFDDFEATLDGASLDAESTIARALDGAGRMLTYLDTDLEIHIRKEEEPLFPLLKAALPADDRLIDEMVAEHDQVRLKRESLRSVLDEIFEDDHAEVRHGREELRAAVSALAGGSISASSLAGLRRTGAAVLQTLRVHFQNEEEIVFPLAPQLLSAGDLAAAGREMVAIGARAETAPAVRAADASPLDLGAAARDLHASPEIARDGRTARTLIKDDALRQVLVALRTGGRLAEHRAPGPASVQVLSGRVAVTLQGVVYELSTGGLLRLPSGSPHAVLAHTDATLLVSMTTA
jgi:quercetin dioxygenase-like cupin family protein/iron-sulfur cluster repair protein YtfE (RIC family)